MNPVTVFQASDLHEHGRAVLDAARAGEARVRDQDGLSLLLLPEHRVRALSAVVRAAINLAGLEMAFATAPARLSLQDYGEWTWLRAFDRDDLAEFIQELRQALIIAGREEAPKVIDDVLDAWRVTAQVLEDPVGRKVLLGEHRDEDFVEVTRPG